MALTKSDVKEILVECARSTETCCRVFYPERFIVEFSPSHRKVFELMDNDELPYVCIAAWRGFGKSSIAQLGYPTRRILFRDSKFMLPISNSLMQAQLHSENLKREFEFNETIHKLGFKNLRSDDWSKDRWSVANGEAGTLVMPRGYGQQVRGLIHGNDRPDQIVLDDLEDSESVMSPEQRAKRKDWFYSDVMNSVSKFKRHKIIYIGTVLHEDALLSNLLEDSNWESIRLSVCDDAGVSNWPQQMSDSEILRLANWFREQGLIDTFFREFRNLPMSKEDAPFKPECFRYFEPKDLIGKELSYVTIVDPAKSVGGRACDTAIVCIGIDILAGKFYIVDMCAQQLHPQEQMARAFEICERNHSRVLGVEVTGSGEYVSWPWRNEIARLGKNLEFVELHARKGPSQYVPNGSSDHGKDSRIGHALVPLYNRGLVYHNKEHPLTQKLEEQLMSFPRGRLKDLIDATAYIVGMMDIGERLFATTHLMSATIGAKGEAYLNCDYEDARLKELRELDAKELAGWRI